MSVDDDDDFVPDTSDAESADAHEREAETESDDDWDEDDVVARGGGISGEVKLAGRSRTVSDSTREAFTKAAQALKSQLGDDELESTMDSDDEPVTQDEPIEAAKAAASAEVEAPAPAPVPDLTAERAALASERAALDVERQQWQDERASSDLGKLRETFFDNPATAVVEFIKQMGGASTDSEVMDEVSDLITELASGVLKTPLDPSERSRLDAKRALRSVRASKAELAADRERQERVAAQTRAETEVVKAQQRLHQEISKPDQAKSFPFLASTAEPGKIVWGVIADAQAQGKELKWTKAAKLANEFLEKQGRAWFDKHAHLLNASPAKAGGDSGTAKTAPGAPPGHRGARTITNAAASAAPPRKDPPKDPSKTWSAEDHRAATKKRFRNAFRAATDD